MQPVDNDKLKIGKHIMLPEGGVTAEEINFTGFGHFIGYMFKHGIDTGLDLKTEVKVNPG